MKTIILDSISVECVLTAIAEKMHSVPKDHPARVNYEQAYKTIKAA